LSRFSPANHNIPFHVQATSLGLDNNRKGMEMLLENELKNEEFASEFLGVARGTLQVWRSTKRYPLPYVKVGRLVRYRLRDLQAFLQARTVGAVD
jgi:hypothetical protein